MLSFIPTSFTPFFKNESVSLGIQRELEWHKSIVNLLYKQNLSLSSILLMSSHRIVVISLYTPVLNVIIYLITYLALLILRPNHLINAYQSTLKQKNLVGARICIDRGISLEKTDKYSQSFLDCLIEEVAINPSHRNLILAYELILKGVKITNDSYAGHLFFHACLTKNFPVISALIESGVHPDNWKKALQTLLRPRPKLKVNPFIPDKFAFCLTDITQLAKSQKLPSLISRQAELWEIAQVFQKRNKNHPLLLGPEGVGKKALVELVTQAILTDDQFSSLRGKHVVKLDLEALGSKEITDKRIMDVISFLRENTHRFILFLDDIQNLGIKTYDYEEPALLHTFLNPLLSQPGFNCILSCDEENEDSLYHSPVIRKHFETIHLKAPHDRELFEILQTAKQSIENFFDVLIEDESITEIIKLCQRFLPNRTQPQVGIEILDRASSHKKIEPLSKEGRQLKSKMPQLTIYSNESSKLKFLETLLAQEAKLTPSISPFIETCRRKIAKQQQEFELEKMIRVGIEDIRQVVAKMSKIPLNRLSEGQTEMLLDADRFLSQQVLGQDHAITIATRAIQVAGAHLSSNSRPLGTFLFVGLSGTGKTRLAKSIAELFFGSQDSIHFIPMGQYQERHNVSNLTGVPPGYVGADKEGSLTRALRKNPRQVLLFDEAEKAHACFWDLLLTICDEGKYKDTSTSAEVNCCHTFIILTSNLGSKAFLQKLQSTPIDDQCSLDSQKELQSLCSLQGIQDIFIPEVNRCFRPEFLARLTVVPFVPIIDSEVIKKIARMHLEQEKRFLQESRYKIQLIWNEQFIHHLIKLSNLKSGIRPIRDFLEKEMRARVSVLILQQKVKEEQTLEYTGDVADQEMLKVHH